MDNFICWTLEGENKEKYNVTQNILLTFRDRRITRRPHLPIGQHGPCIREQFIVVGHQERHVADLFYGQFGGTETDVAVQLVGAFQVQPSGNNNPGRSARYQCWVVGR